MFFVTLQQINMRSPLISYRHFLRFRYSVLVVVVSILTACNTRTDSSSDFSDTTLDTGAAARSQLDSAGNNPTEVKPSGPKPAWAPSITPQMQAVIEKLESYHQKPLENLSASEARKLRSPADAVMDLMKEHRIPLSAAVVDTTGKDIAVHKGKIHLRIYTPKLGNGPFPVIVYFHGGGWVIAGLDTYNASAQSLAEQTGAVLVSVAYRQAPEHTYPAAHQDAFDAYLWVLKNAHLLNGDPKKVAVAGESAGGNLAAAVSMMARDSGVPVPRHEVLIYPIASLAMNTASYNRYAQAKPLNKAMMHWFFAKYLPVNSKNSHLIDLVNADLKGMPPSTVITAEIDPLQSEGSMLADNLKGAGVPVTFKLYKGVTHEFFGMASILPEARDAQALAAGELKKAFEE